MGISYRNVDEFVIWLGQPYVYVCVWDRTSSVAFDATQFTVLEER